MGYYQRGVYIPYSWEQPSTATNTPTQTVNPTTGYAYNVANAGASIPDWNSISNTSLPPVSVTPPTTTNTLGGSFNIEGPSTTPSPTTPASGTGFFDTSKGYAGAASQGLGLASEAANLYGNLEGLGVFGGTSNADLRRQQERSMKQNLASAKYNLGEQKKFRSGLASAFA